MEMSHNQEVKVTELFYIEFIVNLFIFSQSHIIFKVSLI
jgi:hypothetical protein